MKRVLKPDAVAVFLEHMRSEKEFLGQIMDALNHFVVDNFGPNINRRTVDNIHRAGFKVLRETYLFSTIFRLIVAKSLKKKNV